MADDGAFAKKTLDDWAALAETELSGKPVESLDWTTPEGITVKPLYTAADLEAIEAAGFPLRDAMPGFPPYLRGPRATMYANRPWTIRQYSGFSTAEESNRFYRANLRPGRWGCRSPSISPPIAATTATIRASSAMSARPGSRSTRSRT